VNYKTLRFGVAGHALAICTAAQAQHNPLFDFVLSRVDHEGNLMGGVVYQQFTGVGGSCIHHIAGYHPQWINREMLYAAFDFPFNQLKVRKLFATIPSDNRHCLEFNDKFGFCHEATIKGAYPKCDMVLRSLTREECRFLSLGATRPEAKAA
jgi:RimJ/RimL family protein N-acetyltransferase